jgi:hypothetical protein
MNAPRNKQYTPDPAARPLQLRSVAQIIEDPAGLEPPRYIIPRIACEGRLTLLSAREKTGKSTLLTAGAAACSDAKMFPETAAEERTFLGEVACPATVLWVSADQEHATDIALRAVHFNAHEAGFHVLWPGTEPMKDLEMAWLKLGEPNLIVIDSLAAFAHGTVEKASAADQWHDVMQPLLRLARLGPAIVILHHATKGPDSVSRDSTAIAAAVDQCIMVKPVADHPTWRRVESIGRLGRDEFTVALEYDDYRLVGGVELVSSTDSGRERIVLHGALSSDGERTLQQVMTATGWSRSTTQRRLDDDPMVTARKEGQTRMYRLKGSDAQADVF